MATIAVYTNFGGHIVKENRSGTKRGYVPDPLGSTVALVDSTGASTDTWKYWPYGEVESHTGSSTTPFTFVGTLGYFRDLVSKLTYVRARFYQALIGQWQTMDPVWPSEPAYTYTLANPVRFVDSSGSSILSPIKWMLDCFKRHFTECLIDLAGYSGTCIGIVVASFVLLCLLTVLMGGIGFIACLLGVLPIALLFVLTLLLAWIAVCVLQAYSDCKRELAESIIGGITSIFRRGYNLLQSIL